MSADAERQDPGFAEQDEGKAHRVKEKSEMQRLLKEIQQLVSPFKDLLELKASTETFPLFEDKIAKLKTWDGRAFSDAVSLFLTSADQFIQSTRLEREQDFRQIEVSFLSWLDERSIPKKELMNSWRFGSLSPESQEDHLSGVLNLEVRRERAQLRLLYVEDELVPWTPVTSLDDWLLLVQRAYTQLRSRRLDDQTLTDVFYASYEASLHRRQAEGTHNAGLVPLGDFVREVRMMLLAREISKDPFREVKSSWPRWAMTYHLDRYRQLPGIPPEKQLAFEHGSQSTVKEGKCLLLSAPRDLDQKKYCFVRRVAAAS